MTALPGQRSAQRPWRAITSTQRALGRAAQSADGFGAVGIAFIDGETFDVDLMAPGGAQITPRSAEPSPECDGRDDAERQD
ncbi:hypothetical protein [Streptomyces griseus]|uniref:hypothetical protein n=1 Tax=Streptomyces griseus TaxID=1911 RepID=UPI000A38A98E|nr:hypothetical protein [Streptomyces fimicarius]